MVVTVAGRVPPWRRPSRTYSPADLGFADENLPLRAYDVGAFGVISFLKASRGAPFLLFGLGGASVGLAGGAWHHCFVLVA